MSVPVELLMVAGFTTVLGSIFWLLGFLMRRGRRSGWLSAMGRWTRFESGWTKAWRVEFLATDGETYHAWPIMNATTLRPTGEVPVAYDPENPQRAVINTFYHRGGLLKTAGIAVIAIGLTGSVVGMLMGLGSG